MKREITCILCPRGCQLTVTACKEKMNVTGNGCKNGVRYALSEVTNPVRTLTSVLRVGNRYDTMVSVKTSVPVKKTDMLQIISIIRNAVALAPIAMGDVLIHDVFGADIIATKTVE